DVRVGLLEACLLTGGDRQVAHDVERVPTAGSPAADRGDDHLGHGADEALDLQDVQPAGARRVDLLAAPRGLGARVGVVALVPVAIPPPDALVPARAEGPAAVLRAGAVAGEDDGGHV